MNLAASCGSTEILTILIKYFDPNVQDERGFLPIDVAICKHKIEAVRFLAPFTKELRVHEFFEGRVGRLCFEKEIEVLESLIEERRENQFIGNPSKKARLTMRNT